MLTVSIDPGIRGSGVAVFAQEGYLLRAAYVPNPIAKGNTIAEVVSASDAIVEFLDYHFRSPVVSLVVEWPQVYTQAKLKGDPNDLLPLVGVSSAVAGRLAARDLLHYSGQFAPRAWKGNIDAYETIRRIRERLTVSERLAITPSFHSCLECRDTAEIKDCTKTSCLMHNIFDAIGIGLKHLGRFEPQRIIHR